jgi:hypothetical protein
MKFLFHNLQRIVTILLMLPAATLVSELPGLAENFRGSLLSGTIVCTNPTATSTRVNYSLIGDAISTFFFCSSWFNWKCYLF